MSTSPTSDTRTKDIDGLLDRLRFEHDLLVSRTSAILTLDGLLTAALTISTGLTDGVRLLLVLAIIVLNSLWVWRAVSASKFIDVMTEELYRCENYPFLPMHSKLHLEHIKTPKKRWTTQNLFSIYIPSLVICCCVIAPFIVVLETPGAASLSKAAKAPPIELKRWNITFINIDRAENAPSKSFISDYSTEISAAGDLATTLGLIAAIVTICFAWRQNQQSVRIQALLALESRFNAINHAKITKPDAWECIENKANEPIPSQKQKDSGADHLTFETFQFYQQAFVFHKRKAIDDEDYEIWNIRLKSDLATYHYYRAWWRNEVQSKAGRTRLPWHDAFARELQKVVAEWDERDKGKPAIDFAHS